MRVVAPQTLPFFSVAGSQTCLEYLLSAFCAAKIFVQG